MREPWASSHFAISRMVLFKLRSKTAQSRANWLKGSGWTSFTSLSSETSIPGKLSTGFENYGSGTFKNWLRWNFHCHWCCAIGESAGIWDICLQWINNKRKSPDPWLSPKDSTEFGLYSQTVLGCSFYFLRREINFIFNRWYIDMILNGKAPSHTSLPGSQFFSQQQKQVPVFLSILLEIVKSYSSILLYILHIFIFKKINTGILCYQYTAPCLPAPTPHLNS